MCKSLGWEKPGCIQDHDLLAWVGLRQSLISEAPIRTTFPCPLGSNQPKAPAGKLIATALPGPALPKLITFFCLFLLLSLINHNPVSRPEERGLSKPVLGLSTFGATPVAPTTCRGVGERPQLSSCLFVSPGLWAS